jgi:hypothetical protein
MSDDLPYRAEYAKSGRASCKGCKSPIAKDTLRLAVMVQVDIKLALRSLGICSRDTEDMKDAYKCVRLRFSRQFTVFRYVVLCNSISWCQRFGGTCCLRFQN